MSAGFHSPLGVFFGVFFVLMGGKFKPHLWFVSTAIVGCNFNLFAHGRVHAFICLYFKHLFELST